jgi:hypothetical protein
MPLALVVIAARQAQDWIAHCVHSILTQDAPKGWRIGVAIGIDACPSTLAEASRFRDRRVAVRFFPQHVGPYVIFNSLACTAGAEVLVRFDSDDVMLPGYLYEQLVRLGPLAQPSITQSWSIYVDSNLRPCAAPLANGARTSADGRRTQASHGQFLMTRAVLRRLGGFRPWPCHADTEFLERARWSEIPREVVPKHLYLRRVHTQSLTASSRMGYESPLRKALAAQIERAREGYAKGQAPESVVPVIASFVPVG